MGNSSSCVFAEVSDHEKRSNPINNRNHLYIHNIRKHVVIPKSNLQQKEYYILYNPDNLFVPSNARILLQREFKPTDKSVGSVPKRIKTKQTKQTQKKEQALEVIYTSNFSVGSKVYVVGEQEFLIPYKAEKYDENKQVRDINMEKEKYYFANILGVFTNKSSADKWVQQKHNNLQNTGYYPIKDASNKTWWVEKSPLYSGKSKKMMARRYIYYEFEVRNN